MPHADNTQIDNTLHSIGFGPETLECGVDVSRALVYLGRRGQEISTELEAHLVDTARSCEAHARPRGIARCFALETTADNEIWVKGTNLTLTGTGIARHLEGCTYACLLAVTLGMDNERFIARAQALNSLDGLLADACSSSMAEEAARLASARIVRAANAVGFEATKRFSPGYGDFPLDLQPAFLRAIQADKYLGITTGASCIMTPMKSITAVVGLRTDV